MAPISDMGRYRGTYFANRVLLWQWEVGRVSAATSAPVKLVCLCLARSPWRLMSQQTFKHTHVLSRMYCRARSLVPLWLRQFCTPCSPLAEPV